MIKSRILRNNFIRYYQLTGLQSTAGPGFFIAAIEERFLSIMVTNSFKKPQQHLISAIAYTFFLHLVEDCLDRVG